MDIPILLEPTPTGWRASTGAPLNFLVEGPDKDGVLAGIRAQVAAKLSSGASIVPVPASTSTLDMDEIRALIAEMSQNPFMDEWIKGIAEHRAEVNIPPELTEDPDPPASPPLNGTVPSVPGVITATGS